jgi:hypothetical protein
MAFILNLPLLALSNRVSISVLSFKGIPENRTLIAFQPYPCWVAADGSYIGGPRVMTLGPGT